MSKKKNDKLPDGVEAVEPQPKLKKDILSTFITLAVMAVFVVLFLNFVGQRVEVEGNSMEDTLQNGDQLIVNCFTYKFLHGPERFDVVVFRLKDDPKTFYVKRVIGLPGETVQIINSKIYINGEIIEDPYATMDKFPAGAAEVPITLGEDQYFVMGDNRVNSIDSRYGVGPVDRSQFVGKSWIRIWPFSKFGKVDPEES